MRVLPARARLWWTATLVAAVVLVPVCLSQLAPGVPLLIVLLGPPLNALLVIATAPRRKQTTHLPRFDYGGIATVAVLASFGPGAALCAFLGERVAAAFLTDASGTRPSWIKSVYNIAWGSPCLLFSWIVRGLAPDRTLEPVFVAAAWCLANGVMVGMMAALAQRRSVGAGLRLGLTQEGWLRSQEAVLSVLAVVVWWTNPLLLGTVVLLVIGQAITGRRLFHEYESATLAREQARRDPLTRLANRRAFEEELDARPSPCAVLMFDLDHFKRINDTFGHDVGDRVLAEVATLIQGTLGARAFCARLGGEEFCALVADIISDAELLAVAERVRLAIKGLSFADNESLRVTASLGAARPREDERTAREVIMRADQALYRAKRQGRDQVQLDVPEISPLPSARKRRAVA
jgi:diguanylate cyclase (GGDEF)-like protein